MNIEKNKKKLILATNNNNKIKEIKEIFSSIDILIVGLKDLNINIDIVEDGKSFKENAYIKANAIYEYLLENNLYNKNDIIISDDSGLCIDYLNGEPGIYSSRYISEDIPYSKKFEYILEKLKNVEKKYRTCKFVTTICMIYNNDIKYFDGELKGYINDCVKGDNGFGYDPIFYVEEYNDTVASLSSDIKNNISHRKKALDELYKYLKNDII